MTESNLRSIFGKNVRRYRKYKDFSQAKLAEILNISSNFISDLETGKRWVSSDTLVNLAKALGVEPYDLLKPQEIPEDKMIGFMQKYTQQVSQTVSNAVDQCLDEVRKQYFV